MSCILYIYCLELLSGMHNNVIQSDVFKPQRHLSVALTLLALRP